MLGNFSCFYLPSADFFSKLTVSENSFRKTIRVSYSLDPQHYLHSFGPDLGSNCLQRLSADDASMERANLGRWYLMSMAYYAYM